MHKGGYYMDQANKDLRLYAKGHAVPLWKIAGKYGVHEQTLIIWLRKTFDAEKAKEFMAIVDMIAKGG